MCDQIQVNSGSKVMGIPGVDRVQRLHALRKSRIVLKFLCYFYLNSNIENKLSKDTEKMLHRQHPSCGAGTQLRILAKWEQKCKIFFHLFFSQSWRVPHQRNHDALGYHFASRIYKAGK